MTKSATINVRVNPEDKRNAEIILEKLGISMASAISSKVISGTFAQEKNEKTIIKINRQLKRTLVKTPPTTKFYFYMIKS